MSCRRYRKDLCVQLELGRSLIKFGRAVTTFLFVQIVRTFSRGGSQRANVRRERTNWQIFA